MTRPTTRILIENYINKLPIGEDITASKVCNNLKLRDETTKSVGKILESLGMDYTPAKKCGTPQSGMWRRADV